MTRTIEYHRRCLTGGGRCSWIIVYGEPTFLRLGFKARQLPRRFSAQLAKRFLEEKLISMTQRIAGEGLGDVSALTKLSPEAAFTELGKRISKIMFSPSSLSLYRLAVSEAPRFPAAARAFFTYGPHQAIASVKALISHFCERGQFRDCDQERTSRAFLSMLRGNLYLEIVLGCRTESDEKDFESRTKSVVEVFLRGAMRDRVWNGIHQ